MIQNCPDCNHHQYCENHRTDLESISFWRNGFANASEFVYLSTVGLLIAKGAYASLGTNYSQENPCTIL